MSFIKLLSIIFIVGIFAFACQPKNETIVQSVEKQTYKSVGVIREIDIAAGKITIDHEEIAGYMSAMQMTESVSEKSILSAIKVGDKVDFELERDGSKLLITKITKIGEVAVLNGAEIYKTNCVECHGATGEGEKKGISLVAGHALHHSEVEHIKQVTNGEGEKMPAFRDKLSGEQIAEVVKFVRQDLQKNPTRESSNKHKH